ncbi:hypothetical protein [Nocardia sp. CC227C]|uniref:hypothetical protein n=1 Tax=Nocardia sp. CC227C TaxID=3044562 RepID=UPI00278C2A76|nr:hypothetical protein [Nocardia sp. CC227C]
MTAPTPDRAVAAYQSTVSLLRSRILHLSRQSWDTLGSYRDSDIDRLIALLVPRVQAAQLQIANLTSNYLVSLLTAEGIEAEPAPVDRDEILQARGVPAGQVYRRPAIEVYSALAEGKTVTAAIAAGRTRLMSLVSTDLQMAKVRQSRSSLARSRAKYFRRVLKGSENCAKCIITSTRRYTKSSLLPIHPGCDCDVAPIRESDPPLALDRKLLDATHEQVQAFADIENAAAEGYQDLIVEHEHGEIGPVLGWRHQKFTGPADI